MLDIKTLNIEQYSQELMHRISTDIGGLIVKLIQVLSIREDVITSPILRKAFKEAQDNNPSRDESQVMRILQKEYGHQKFVAFNQTYKLQFPAIKSGSVGQIHYAIPRQPGNPTRILKITFHEEVSVIWRQQWELVKMFGESHAIPMLHNCWDTISSMEDNLFGEMNFDQESRYTKLAYQAIGDSDIAKTAIELEIQQAMMSMGFNLTESYLPCRIVGIIDDWSTSHVLMQEMAQGKNLKDWLDNNHPSFEQKSKVFKSLIVWWAYLAFKKHIVHSDPHYGNIMVHYDDHGEPLWITIIDFGQTDLFLPSKADAALVDSKYQWFLTFKKLMRKINAVYDGDEIQFGHNVERLLENVKQKLIEEGKLHKLLEKVFLESIDTRSMFGQMFLEDLANVMMELGFESEKNSARLLGGLAMGALNNDPKYTGAKKTQENVQLDPLKTFPPKAALIFRSVTGIVGMLDDQQAIEKRSLTDDLSLVPMFKPFL